MARAYGKHHGWQPKKIKRDYFNEREYRDAMSLDKSNPQEAKNRLERYLEKYPNDYFAYGDYAYILIVLGMFDDAKKILDNVKVKIISNTSFNREHRKKIVLEDKIWVNTLRLLFYQGNYEEIYQFCINNPREIARLDLTGLEFFCKIKLGKFDSLSREAYSYRIRQMIEYQEEDFLDHIKRHLADYNQNLDNPNAVIFSVDFPLQEIVEEIKKYIPSDKRLYQGTYNNKYIFRYDNCGRVNNKLVNYFNVICLHDTANFITIYPAEEGEHLLFIDLNYLNKENQNTKVKKLSQIDKFNQRYKRG